MKLLVTLLLWSFLVLSLSLDLTAIKWIYCNRLREHWAYDRLDLKHNCLQMTKQLGSELCLDVTEIFFSFVH